MFLLITLWKTQHITFSTYFNVSHINVAQRSVSTVNYMYAFAIYPRGKKRQFKYIDLC